jgi:hypothetical protein
MRRIVVVGIALGMLAAACGTAGARSLGPVNTGPGTLPTTAPPTGSPSSGSSGTPKPTTNRPVSGTVIDPVGMVLHPVHGPPVTPVGPTAPCEDLIDPGWTGSCARVDMAGGTVIWVVEQQAVAGGCCDARIARVFRYSSSAAGWYPELEAKDLNGSLWDGASIKSLDLTGDGEPELLAGFRYLGSGFILSYDIVTFPLGGVPRVAAHPTASDHGSVTATTGRLDEYSAQYPNGEPECCPAYFQHRLIRYDGTVFRAMVLGHTASAPGQDWPPISA